MQTSGLTTILRSAIRALSVPTLLLPFLLVACEPTSSPNATPVVTTISEQDGDADTTATPLVRVDSDITPVARVGGDVVLELDVSNVGPRDIQDLTIIVNDAYMANMARVETNPAAVRHNEQSGEYFTFGTLPKAARRRYVIRMPPNEPGAFLARVAVAEWSPTNMLPLAEAEGGVAEYAHEIQVLPQ